MKINLKLLIVLLTVLAIYAFPQEVHAEHELFFYYVQYDNNGEAVWKKTAVTVGPEPSLDRRAFALFKAFFTSELPSSVPGGTRLLQAYVIEGELFLNVSEEILQYGGTYNETIIKEQIFRTARELDGADTITLLIEGWETPLTEGTLISHVSLPTFTDVYPLAKS